MAKQLFANNVSTPIMEFLTASDTTISVSSTSRFPTISGGDWIMATLVPQGGFGTPEIIKITSFTGNTVTATRGQEGTTAQDFQFGSLMELRLTKGTLEELRDFTQSGTGAVARTKVDKLKEWVSVKDFGATGDGTTDDTAAIQAAIDYCTNLSNRKQTLYFPGADAAQVYKITSPLTISGRLTIVGDGQFSTIIFASGFSAGQYILNFDNLAASTVYYGGVENISLKGSSVNARGIRLNNASYWNIRNVTLDTLSIGVLLTGTACFSNFFENVVGTGISSSTVKWESFSGGGQYRFDGCTFTGSDGVVLDSASATDSLAFYDCNFEQCTTTDLYINGTVNGLTISSCRSEGLDGASSFLISPAVGKSVRGISITGCFWQTDFGNAYAVDIGGDVSGFDITGNVGANVGFLSFVRLAGAGAAGVISGNYAANSPTAVTAARDTVIVYGNNSSSGALPEHYGTASWKVTQASYTGTATGMTTSPTGTVTYSIVGNTVTLNLPTISGTSNATTFTITGGPAAIRPATDKDILVRAVDNGTGVLGFARVKTTGVIELYSSVAGAGWTAAGTKTISPNSFSYTLV